MTSLIKSRSTDAVSVILFCKAPVPGRVKTRLASDFAAAVDFYASLVDSLIHRIEAETDIKLFLFVDSENLSYFDERYPNLPIVEQQGDDLGERMKNAFAHVFSLGATSSVVLAGSDVPDFTAETARKMAEICKESEAVILPSADGGYSAICLNRRTLPVLHRLFHDIVWSTPSVLETQLQRIVEAGLKPFLMKEWMNDIDTLEDLLAYRKIAERRPLPDVDMSFLKHIPRVVAILPVLNEAESLPLILPSLLESIWINEVVCIDNGSTDDSPSIIRRNRVTLLQCRERGYGAAMMTGIEYVSRKESDTILLFMDADGSDDQTRIGDLLRPILAGRVDFVLGARQGGLLLHQRAGNILAVWLICMLWRHSFSDLGPFRAIRLKAIQSLEMDDRNFGWTIQMQIRAVQQRLRIMEISVPSLRRLGGKSKVSGTVRGTVLAGTIILRTIFREWCRKQKGFTSNRR